MPAYQTASAGTLYRRLIRKTVVLERATTVGVLLKDHLVNQGTRLHAAQGQQAVRPCVRSVAHKLRDGCLTTLSRFRSALQKRIDPAPGSAHPLTGRKEEVSG